MAFLNRQTQYVVTRKVSTFHMWRELKKGSKQILTLMLGAAAGKCVSTLAKLPEPPGTRESGGGRGELTLASSSHRL